MEGGGAYNRSSTVQAAGLAPAVPWLTEAAKLVPLGLLDEPLIIADYGSSQGRNSLAPLGAAIGVLRETRRCRSADLGGPHRSAGQRLQRVVRDRRCRPGQLSRRRREHLSLCDRALLLRKPLSPGSVTLGWSSWAVQWMSRAPAAVPDHIHHSHSAVASVRAAYARQGAEDWKAFLTLRGRELRPGRRLVILLMALEEDGDFGFGPVMDHLQAALTK
jgi:hypothetical protein